MRSDHVRVNSRQGIAHDLDRSVTIKKLSFTPGEHAVAELLLEGITIPEIAERLTVSVNTARMHIKRLHTKTETRTLHGLVLWIVRQEQAPQDCWLAAQLEQLGSTAAPPSAFRKCDIAVVAASFRQLTADGDHASAP